jgi:hypothetical protein
MGVHTVALIIAPGNGAILLDAVFLETFCTNAIMRDCN